MLTSTGLFAVVLTLGTYEVGLWLQKKTGSALCNPLLISIILVMAALGLLKIPAETYGAKMDSLSWLLTPATVCLAVPLYEQVRVLKKNLLAIFAGVVAGTATSLVCVGLMSRFLALESPILASLLPKSVTTALAIAIARRVYGGSDHHRHFRLRLRFRALQAAADRLSCGPGRGLRHRLPCAGYQPGGRDFGAHGSGQLPVSCCGGDPDGDLLPCLVLPGGIKENRIEGVENYA